MENGDTGTPRKGSGSIYAAIIALSVGNLHRKRRKRMKELFSSRREIEDLMKILQEWMEAYPEDGKKEYATRLSDKLDFIHMTW